MTPDAPGEVGNPNAGLTGFEYSTSVQRPEAGGYVEIQFLSVGDLATARCDEAGQIASRRISRYLECPSVKIVRVLTQTDTGGTDSLGTPPEQPFWVDGRGWVEARSLTAGKVLLSLFGIRTIVLGVRDEGYRTEVFHIEVEGSHTYFAGNHGVLVHDTCKAARVSAP